MPGLMFNVVKDPKELKANPLNFSIYGEEKVDYQLVESIKSKGLLEPLVIKDDNTLISGHRRWLALKELGIKANCRIITFDNELDEQETLIEFNKQREKTPSQVYNESNTLQHIYSERARLRQVDAGKYGNEGGRGNKKEETLVATLPQGFKEPRVREKLSETLGIPQKKLETIMEVGKLAETGKTKTVRKEEEKLKTVSPDTQKQETKKPTNEEKYISQFGKELMKELDEGKTSFSAARDAVKLINETPTIAKDVIEAKKAAPDRTVRELIKSKADKNSLAYVGSLSNGQRDSDTWYTPKTYIEAVKEVLGSIELDPYSDEIANTNIQAERIFTQDEPAELQEWDCKTLWMNPPYTGSIIKTAICKFIEEYKKYNFSAVIVTNNATETRWFKALVTNSDYFCFTDHRIAFETYDGKNESNNTRGQTFFYFGEDANKFKAVFSKFGWCGSYGGN